MCIARRAAPNLEQILTLVPIHERPATAMLGVAKAL
jgi:hypothetical protein